MAFSSLFPRPPRVPDASPAAARQLELAFGGGEEDLLRQQRLERIQRAMQGGSENVPAEGNVPRHKPVAQRWEEIEADPHRKRIYLKKIQDTIDTLIGRPDEVAASKKNVAASEEFAKANPEQIAPDGMPNPNSALEQDARIPVKALSDGQVAIPNSSKTHNNIEKELHAEDPRNIPEPTGTNHRYAENLLASFHNKTRGYVRGADMVIVKEAFKDWLKNLPADRAAEVAEIVNRKQILKARSLKDRQATKNLGTKLEGGLVEKKDIKAAKEQLAKDQAYDAVTKEFEEHLLGLSNEQIDRLSKGLGRDVEEAQIKASGKDPNRAESWGLEVKYGTGDEKDTVSYVGKNNSQPMETKHDRIRRAIHAFGGGDPGVVGNNSKILRGGDQADVLVKGEHNLDSMGDRRTHAGKNPNQTQNALQRTPNSSELARDDIVMRAVRSLYPKTQDVEGFFADLARAGDDDYTVNQALKMADSLMKHVKKNEPMSHSAFMDSKIGIAEVLLGRVGKQDLIKDAPTPYLRRLMTKATRADVASGHLKQGERPNRSEIREKNRANKLAIEQEMSQQAKGRPVSDGIDLSTGRPVEPKSGEGTQKLLPKRESEKITRGFSGQSSDAYSGTTKPKKPKQSSSSKKKNTNRLSNYQTCQN